MSGLGQQLLGSHGSSLRVRASFQTICIQWAAAAVRVRVGLRLRCRGGAGAMALEQELIELISKHAGAAQLIGWLTGWLTGWLADCMAGWLAD